MNKYCLLFFLWIFGLPSTWSFAQESSTEWIPFSDSGSPQIMKKQIFDEVKRLAQSNQFIRYQDHKIIETRFEEERQQIEKIWEEQFREKDQVVRESYDQLLVSRSKASEAEVRQKQVLAKTRQLQQSQQRLRDHQNSLTDQLRNIAYHTLVFGIQPQESNWKNAHQKLAPLMGQIAVQQINGTEIHSLQIVRDNQLLQERVQSIQQGHFKTGNAYDERLEDFDEDSFQTQQIEFGVFYVFPFAQGKSLSGEGSSSKAKAGIVRQDNLESILKSVRLTGETSLIDWTESQLAKIENHNADLEQDLREKMRKWEWRKKGIQQEINTLRLELERLKQRTQGKRVGIEKARKDWQEAYQSYHKHLLLREVWQRKKESNALMDTEKSREAHLAHLARETLTTLQDFAGDYQERVLVVNFEQEEYSEEQTLFQERKKAFKILYLTGHRPGNRVIWTVSVGYQVELSPVSGTKGIVVQQDQTNDSETNDSQNNELQNNIEGTMWTDPITGMEFVSVQGGCYQMGSPSSESESYGDEGPQHEVCVDDFYTGIYEVTNAQFRKFRSSHSSKDFASVSLNEDQQAVVYVSWEDTQAFIQWLNQSSSRVEYRLPTEAEWEYASRGGSKTARFWGDDASQACLYANVRDKVAREKWGWGNIHDCNDSYAVTAPVGSFKPNPFGLYDTLGNVWEWVEDNYARDAYKKHKKKNPLYQSPGDPYIIRGGSWYYRPRLVRSSYRTRYSAKYRSSNIGFRLIMENKEIEIK